MAVAYPDASPAEPADGRMARSSYVNQQGDRVDVGADPALETAAVTYAIWGPFER
jgi:hypothetical protein